MVKASQFSVVVKCCIVLCVIVSKWYNTDLHRGEAYENKRMIKHLCAYFYTHGINGDLKKFMYFTLSQIASGVFCDTFLRVRVNTSLQKFFGYFKSLRLHLVDLVHSRVLGITCQPHILGSSSSSFPRPSIPLCTNLVL